jgi:hypothetical protein
MQDAYPFYTRMNEVALPYFASAEDLPADIPTKDAIDNSKDIICDRNGSRVVGLGPHFVAKYGVQVNLDEGRTMIFISHTTAVSVPIIYALFEDHESKRKYIVMERIHGDRLDVIWESLDNARKQCIVEQLKFSFAQIRELPSPGGYCSLDEKPLRDPIFCTGSEEQFPDLGGPFATETALNEALVKKYLASEDLPPAKAQYYRRAFPSVLTGYPPTFTHGDLQRKNIILNADEHKITIIDWEFAGWLPSYWEYSRAMIPCGRFNDNWWEIIECCLHPHRNEWLWTQMLYLELWS